MTGHLTTIAAGIVGAATVTAGLPGSILHRAAFAIAVGIPGGLTTRALLREMHR